MRWQMKSFLPSGNRPGLVHRIFCFGKNIKMTLAPRVPGSRSPTDLDRIVGANVRRLRLERGVTLQTLAEALSISHQQLQKYETGSNRLSAGLLPVVAEALSVRLEELFFHEETARSDKPSRADRLRGECETLLRRTKSEEALAAMSRVLKALAT